MGLSKMHKVGVALRPTVSYSGAPTYQPSKLLMGIISPLLGKKPFYVKDSHHFTEFAKAIHLELVDFVSLFTKVPVEEAVEMTRK